VSDVIKIGDLVRLKRTLQTVGALTAIKYMERLKRQTLDRAGIVVADHGKQVSVLFDSKKLVIHKQHLEIVSKN